MGRKAVIDRENLLDIAEALVRENGAGALTIGGLAAAAGISKGGVQYSFATKDDLVRGLVDRWTARFERMMEGTDAGPIDFVRRYIAVTRASGAMIDARIAAVMMSYMRDPENLRATRAWYQGILSRLSGDSPDARLARVAFLALEGLFLMRVNGLDSQMQWEGFLQDVEAMLSPDAASPGMPHASCSGCPATGIDGQAAMSGRTCPGHPLPVRPPLHQTD